jgi:hypothetical protein
MPAQWLGWNGVHESFAAVVDIVKHHRSTAESDKRS